MDSIYCPDDIGLAHIPSLKSAQTIADQPPDHIRDVIRFVTSIYQFHPLRFVGRQFLVSIPDPLMEITGFALNGVQVVIAGMLLDQPRHAFIDWNIQHNGQIRHRSSNCEFIDGENLLDGKATPIALVGRSGVGKAITDYTGTALQCGIDPRN